MNNNRKKLTLKITEFVLIFLLSAALIAMFAGYCLLKNSSPYSGIPEVDLRNSDTLFNNTDTVPSRNAMGLLSLSFVGFSEEKHISPADKDTFYSFCNDIKPFIQEVFSDVSTILEFSSVQNRNDYIERSIYGRESFIYVEFPYDLPASAVYAALTGDTLDNIYHAFNVKKLFIFCEDNGSVSGAVLDSRNNIATLTVRSRSALSFERIREYKNAAGMKDFEFVVHEDKKYAVLSSSVSRKALAAYNNSGDFLTVGSPDAASVLSALCFNPNGTHYFRTGDSITYVEEVGELSISDAGNITYFRTGEGIGLSDLTGKHKDVYSFEDKIVSAYNVLEKLDKNFFGGCATHSLISVTHDKNTGYITLDFGYFSDGIRIGETQSASLVFDNNSLVCADIKAISFFHTENTFSDIPQKLLFVFALPYVENTKPIDFVPIYTLSEDGLYRAKYAFVSESNTSDAFSEKSDVSEDENI